MNKAVDITVALEQKVLSVQAFYANRGSTVNSYSWLVSLWNYFQAIDRLEGDRKGKVQAFIVRTTIKPSIREASLISLWKK
ncbi:hypothetical protein DB42_EV00170 [Neochlamydia sp. EPS4]|uniref:hypothetical protein n=1 Tax=Neochlamydia sp. EPS4 TaxID=1478175 RepID=UPI000582D108|nr:hypothetical protein [Neochlamydia sp. EPS4]KIC75627.1 hypothetical protein DB42_EV00170 [Neochlamydia sp. EPS4]